MQQPHVVPPCLLYSYTLPLHRRPLRPTFHIPPKNNAPATIPDSESDGSDWDKAAWAAYYEDEAACAAYYEGKDNYSKIEHCGLVVSTDRITLGWYKGIFYDECNCCSAYMRGYSEDNRLTC